MRVESLAVARRLFRSLVLIAVLACPLLLVACDSVNDENYAKLHQGMTLQEAERVLGSGQEETSGGYGVSAGGVMTGNTGQNDSVKTYSWGPERGKQIVIDFKGGQAVTIRKLNW